MRIASVSAVTLISLVTLIQLAVLALLLLGAVGGSAAGAETPPARADAGDGWVPAETIVAPDGTTRTIPAHRRQDHPDNHPTVAIAVAETPTGADGSGSGGGGSGGGDSGGHSPLPTPAHRPPPPLPWPHHGWSPIGRLTTDVRLLRVVRVLPVRSIGAAATTADRAVPWSACAQALPSRALVAAGFKVTMLLTMRLALAVPAILLHR